MGQEHERFEIGNEEGMGKGTLRDEHSVTRITTSLSTRSAPTSLTKTKDCPRIHSIASPSMIVPPWAQVGPHPSRYFAGASPA